VRYVTSSVRGVVALSLAVTDADFAGLLSAVRAWTSGRRGCSRWRRNGRTRQPIRLTRPPYPGGAVP
jgi:hypothetical protein